MTTQPAEQEAGLIFSTFPAARRRPLTSIPARHRCWAPRTPFLVQRPLRQQRQSINQPPVPPSQVPTSLDWPKTTQPPTDSEGPPNCLVPRSPNKTREISGDEIGDKADNYPAHTSQQPLPTRTPRDRPPMISDQELQQFQIPQLP